MDTLPLSVPNRRRHSNAGYTSHTLAMVNSGGETGCVLETINETSTGRSRTSSFTRVKEMLLFRGARHRSGSANTHQDNVSLVGKPPHPQHPQSQIKPVVNNHVIANSPDVIPAGSQTVRPDKNALTQLSAKKISQVGKDGKINNQHGGSNRQRSQSEVVQPISSQLVVDGNSSTPTKPGCHTAMNSVTSSTADSHIIADKSVEKNGMTPTAMSQLLSGTTGSVSGSTPSSTIDENHRIGPSEFMELYRTVAYNNAVVSGSNDQRAAAIQALRSRRQTDRMPIARRTSIAVAPVAGSLGLPWHTIDEVADNRTRSSSSVAMPGFGRRQQNSQSRSPPGADRNRGEVVPGQTRRVRRYSEPAADIAPLSIRRSSIVGNRDELITDALSNFPKLTASSPVRMSSDGSQSSTKHVIVWRDRINGTRIFHLPGPDGDLTRELENFGGNEYRFISKFMKNRRCYDLMPYSSKVILFDVELEVICAMYAMLYNGVKAGPVWDGSQHRFVGLLTVTDFIRILQRFYRLRGNFDDIETHKISDWRTMLSEDVKPEVVQIDAEESLYDAARMLRNESVHRLLVVDQMTQNALYVLTYKRLLRYLFCSTKSLPRPEFMSKSIHELDVGTYNDITTVTLSTSLITTLNLLVERRVSAIPIVDSYGRLLNIYTKYDVINLARDQLYSNLDCSMDQALSVVRDTFEGLYTCKKTDSLEAVIHWFINLDIHRMVVVNDVYHIEGIISLSDIIHFLVLNNDSNSDEYSDTNSESSEELVEKF